jgi:hypothetical protein
MSMARPKACSDHLLVPATFRQLKPELLLAAMAASSSAPKTVMGSIRSIGNPASNNNRNTPVTSVAQSKWITSWPV